MEMNYESVYETFGSQESYEEWFKNALREELERRQMAAAREEANKILQETAIVLPPELM